MNSNNFRKKGPAIYPLSLPLLSNPDKVAKGIYGFFKDECDVFKLDIVFPKAGVGNSILSKSNIFCADMLLSGTNKLSAQELNEKLDFLGSYINVTTTYYKTVLSVYGMNRYFDEVLELIHEAVFFSTFPQSELDLLKQQKKNNLRVQHQKTVYQSSVLMNKYWFGDGSILGKPTDEEDYAVVTRELLQNEFKTKFNECFLILTSSKALSSKTKQIEEVFKDKLTEDLTFVAQEIKFIKKHAADSDCFYCVSNANQSSFNARLEVDSRNTNDYASITMLNLILGGYFGSRLMKNIREDKGWTYGVSSRIVNYSDNAFIEVSGDIQVDKASPVKDEILKEFNKLSHETVSNEEFETARNYYLGNLQEAFDSYFSFSERHLALLETKNTLSWYNTFADKIKLLTPSQVQQAAQNYLNSNSLIYTWSGPNP